MKAKTATQSFLNFFFDFRPEREQGFVRLTCSLVAALLILFYSILDGTGIYFNPYTSAYYVLLVFSPVIQLIYSVYKSEYSTYRILLNGITDGIFILGYVTLTGDLRLPVFIFALWLMVAYTARYGYRIGTFVGIFTFVGIVFGREYTELYGMAPIMPDFAFIIFFLSLLAIYLAYGMRKLTSEKRRVEQLNRIKDTFLANVSHELRTPINGIIGTATLMQDQLHNKELLAEYVQRISTNATYLTDLIGDILDISKLDTNSMLVNKSDVDTCVSFIVCANKVEHHAKAKGLSFDLFIDNNIPDYIATDWDLLERAIITLVSNAIKFTEFGSVSLRFIASEIQSDSVTLRIEIEDTGIGIPESFMPSLFKRFEQANRSITRQYGGTGLGTAIAAETIELLGGEIEVSSEEGKGTLFWLTLPVEILSRRSESHIEHIEHIEQLVLLKAASEQDPVWIQKAIDYCPNNVSFLATDTLSTIKNTLPKFTVVIATEQYLRTADKEDVLDVPVIAIIDSREQHLEIRKESLSCQNVLSVVDIGAHSTSFLKALSIYSEWLVTNTWTAQRSGDIEEQTVPSFSILIADDNPTNLDILKTYLLNHGQRVTAVINGEEALNELLIQEFDFAILDYRMPRMDGLTAIEKYYESLDRTANNWHKTEIYLLTADLSDSVKEKSEKIGVKRFIPKPVDLNALLKMLVRKAQSSTVVQDDTRNIIDPTCTAQLFEVYESDDKKLTKYIEGYFSQINSLEASINIYLAAQDTERLHRVIHKALGSSKQIGASLLASRCAYMEKLVKKGELDELVSQLEPLRKEIIQAIEAIQMILDRYLSKRYTTRSGAVEVVAPMLNS